MINLITLLVHANAKIVNYVVISSGKAFVSSFFRLCLWLDVKPMIGLNTSGCALLLCYL